MLNARVRSSYPEGRVEREAAMDKDLTFRTIAISSECLNVEFLCRRHKEQGASRRSICQLTHVTIWLLHVDFSQCLGQICSP